MRRARGGQTQGWDEDDGTGRAGRRAFMVGVAGLAVAAPGVTSAVAAPRPDATVTAVPPLRRAAGVAVLGESPKALCLLDGAWVLVDESGNIYPTTGLRGVTVLDVGADERGVLAAGSVPSATGTEAAVWQSADGITWHEVMRLSGVNSEFTGVGSGPGTAMALGSVLTEERAPQSTIAARRVSGAWAQVPVTGLERTDEHAITTLSGNGSGWVAAAVTQDGTTLFQSRDGSSWGELEAGALADAAVQGVLLEANGGVLWVANAVGGSAAVAGKVGAGRAPVAVPQDAHAVGAVWGRGGPLSYWLADGRLVAAGI